MGGVRQRGKKWYYYFNAGKKPDGSPNKIERVGGSTKKEALQSLRIAELEYSRCGSHIDESSITVNEYLDYWLENYVKINLKDGTYDGYERLIRNHIKPSLGVYLLKNIKPNTLQEFLNSKYLNGFSKNYLSNMYGVLSGSFKYAVYPCNYIKENPMTYVNMPKYDEKPSDNEDLKIISIQEFNKIVNRFPQGSRFYVPLQIAFNTGLRGGEVCGLTWDDIDFENSTITVNKSLKDKGKGIFKLESPKTKASYRTIKIGSTLLNILKENKKWQKENKLKYGQFYKDNNFVCTNENGENFTTNTIKYLSRVVNYDLLIDFDFHSLRHTHATILIENGANMKDVQKRLGHSKLSTTMDTYAHVTPKMQDDSVNRFEKAICHQC